MVGKRHLLFLEKLIDKINLKKINGSIVECGVWKGGCMMYMLHCQKNYNMNRDIYLYDTFDGMTPPINNKNGSDAKKKFNKISSGRLRDKHDKWHNENKWVYAPLELVKEKYQFNRL